MVKIKQQLVASRAKASKGTNGRKYITIHETANQSRGANAQAHANLQTNGFSASWHYTVDDKQAIQSFPHSVRCWHSGDGTGAGNFESIGIEICVNSDGNFKKAVQNASELVKKIMKDENIPLSNVVQHNKWSGKNCPTNLRNGSKGINWNGFKELVGDDVVEQASKPKPSPSKSKPSKPVAKPSTSKGIAVDGYWGADTTRGLQRYFGTYVDGVVSGQYKTATARQLISVTFNKSGSPVIKKLQHLVGVKADGLIGPSTVRAMQKRFGTYADGVISKPSPMVKELQRRLNKGKL